MRIKLFNLHPGNHSPQLGLNNHVSKAELPRRYAGRWVAGLRGSGGTLCAGLFMSIVMMSSTASGELVAAGPISPVPLTVELDQRKVELGRQLFADSRLSVDKGVSCATCHQFERGLTDGIPISRGLPGKPGIINTLSLFNVGLSSKLSWSGKYMTLEEQARAVIESERSMGAKWDDVIALLKNDMGLTATFDEIYDDGIQPGNVVDALVEFEESLNTPNAPFDRYLRGEDKAISEEAKSGYELFKNYGCISCHQGVNVGGNMLQVFGIFGRPKGANLGSQTPGSAKDSGIAEDAPVFRVPVLRNVQFTAPYFHDGSAANLSEAIATMARYQLGRSLTDEDIAKIEAFLNSLSGEYQGVSIGKL
jgi:cytochrome c peroxidase